MQPDGASLAFRWTCSRAGGWHPQLFLAHSPDEVYAAGQRALGLLTPHGAIVLQAARVSRLRPGGFSSAKPIGSLLLTWDALPLVFGRDASRAEEMLSARRAEIWTRAVEWFREPE